MPQPPAKPVMPVWMRVVIIVTLIVLAYYSQRDAGHVPQPNRESPPKAPPGPVSVKVIGNDQKENDQKEIEAPRELDREKAGGVRETQTAPVIKNVALKDQSGKVLFQGDIDLGPTLQRIENGELLDRFSHDGSTFQNREKRIPRQPAGYYREYVVPTPGQNGPGPQRLVIGRDGEIFYTHDHYKSFRKVK